MVQPPGGGEACRGSLGLNGTYIRAGLGDEQ